MTRHLRRCLLTGLLGLAALSACAPQDGKRSSVHTEPGKASLCGMQQIVEACQDTKRPTNEIEKITAAWCADNRETIEETLTACQQGRVAEAEQEAEKISQRLLIHTVETVCDDDKSPSASAEPMMALWCDLMQPSAAAIKQGRFTKAKEEAAKTAERFLVHLKDKDYEAVKDLSVESARSFLDSAEKGIIEPAWDSTWRKIRSGIPSWKMDGWGAKIGKLYNGHSAQKAVEKRHKPVLRARDETFVILAYTLKHLGESDTALDFILLPTEQGWRISEILIVGDKPPAQNVLRFQDVTSDLRQIDGVAHLIVEGQIFNPTKQPQNVPPLVFTLFDPDGTELKRWTFHAEVTVVAAGGSVPFQTSTANPPSKGNLDIHFLPLVQ